MMRRFRPIVALSVLVSMTGCGYFSEDPKNAAEQQWLLQQPEIATAIAQIREQGLQAVAQSAESGTVAACVASRLTADPMGKLISVEGALVESAQVAKLLADMEQLFSQEMSLNSVASMLEQGADAAAYAKTIISQQGFEQALQTLKTLAQQSQNFATQDLGGHLQQVISNCQPATKPDAAATSAPQN
jgi:hypothetical protein